jgi:hypothetical protein
MRGVWRLLFAVIVGGIALVFWPNWHLLWVTEKASFVALAVLMTCGWAAAIGLAIAAIRWFVLACWPGPLGIEVSPERVWLTLGPFGKQVYEWSALRLELSSDIDPDLIELMPDDAFIPRLLVISTGKDLIDVILRFTRTAHEELTRALRPYLLRTRNPTDRATAL